MGQRHSQHDRSNRDTFSPPSPMLDTTKPRNPAGHCELAHLIDGEPSTKKSREERDQEFWNSIMSEGTVQPKNDYAKGFPYNPCSGYISVERRVVEAREREDAVRRMQFGKVDEVKDKGKEKVVEKVKDKGKEKVVEEEDIPKIVEDTVEDVPGFEIGFQQNKSSDLETPSTLSLGSILESPVGLAHLTSSPLPSTSASESRIGVAQPITSESEAVERPPSPSALTWNTVLNLILESGYIDPEIISALQGRVPTSAQPSLDNTDMVPNFSRPIVGSAFYDRREGLPTQNLPSGVSPSSSHHSTSPSSSSSSASSTSDDQPILLPSPTSSSPKSPATQIRHHESTISTQTHLIRTLHTTIDHLSIQLSTLQRRDMPQLTRMLDERDEGILTYGKLVDALKSEIADLKKAVDFGGRTLSGCWEREWEMWRWVNEMKFQWEMKQREESFLGRLFGRKAKTRRVDEEMGIPSEVILTLQGGGGEVPESAPVQPKREGSRDGEAGNAGVGALALASKPQLDALVRITEQNLRVLKEDVEEMVRLVEVCREHNAGAGAPGSDREDEQN